MTDPAPSYDDPLADLSDAAPVWPIFGDLMAGLMGIFVLLFVWAIAFQADVAAQLNAERLARQAESERLRVLESALAGPLARGLITLVDGRIGIRGSVLFEIYSAELTEVGRALVAELAGPLAAYVANHDEMIMVSGFTDDLAIHGRFRRFADNWELSTQRALTVTRALTAAGVPSSHIFAAGFGDNQPVSPNVDERSRARNRRVEIVPVPRRSKTRPAGSTDSAEPSTPADSP